MRGLVQVFLQKFWELGCLCAPWDRHFGPEWASFLLVVEGGLSLGLGRVQSFANQLSSLPLHIF